MQNGQNEIPSAPATQEELTEELLHQARQTGPRLKTLIIVLGALALLGFVGIAMRFSDSTGGHTAWNFYAVGYVYVFSLTMGVPLAGFALRMVRAQWRRPTSRAAELFAIAGPVNLIFFIPLVIALPPLEGRNSLWMDWQLAPWLPDILMMVILVITGLGFLYTSMLPDLAAVRDHGSGWTQGMARRMARGWIGTEQQWASHKSALGMLGAFYMMAYAVMHVLIATDFAMSLVPGWKDPIFTVFHGISGIQMGLALLLVTMFVLRKWGGMSRYFELEQFWGYSRILVALTLFWFYFWWSGFILFWYARLPHEQSVIALLMFGDATVSDTILARPQFLMFAGAIGLSFIVPFLLIMWNFLRRSIRGPAIVGIVILFGGFFDRMRIYANSWSVEQVGGHGLESLPAIRGPDLADAFVLVGMLSAVLFLYLMTSRLVPFVSLWETREALLLRVVRPFGIGHAHVVAKPD